MREIVVVGAGIVGLAFSVAAARQEFMVEVFDKNPQPQLPGNSSSNVLALNCASKRFSKLKSLKNMRLGRNHKHT